jgi:(S)-ureidoglycine-glyoxylate aminotransferase
MIMDYWSEKRLNHHTEATSMLYAAREAACIVLEEGLENRFTRHTQASTALIAGLRAMDLEIFGQDAHRMTSVTGLWIPENINGEAVRTRMREDFGIEIGTAFGPLAGRIWRIGTMGYNAVKHKILLTLGALEAALAAEGYPVPRGAAVDAALACWP